MATQYNIEICNCKPSSFTVSDWRVGTIPPKLPH